MIFAYEAFDPADATAQCIDGDDDGGGGFHCSQLQVPLAANASVQLVVTGFNDTDVGPYQLGVLSPGTTVTIDPL